MANSILNSVEGVAASRTDQTERSSWIIKHLQKQSSPIWGIVVAHGDIYYTNSDGLYKLGCEQPLAKGFFVNLAFNGADLLFMCSRGISSAIHQYSIQTGELISKQFSYRSVIHSIACHNNEIYFTHTLGVKITSQDIRHQQDVRLWDVAGHKASDTGFRDGMDMYSKFNYPSGIVVCEDNSVLICDTQNHCIRKISRNVVYTIAGTPGSQGSKDSTLFRSQFYTPYGLDIDSHDGTLLVGDHNCIRRVDLTNDRVTTVFQGLGKYLVLRYYEGNILVGNQAGELMVLKPDTWKDEIRYLWIGQLKESAAYCELAKLPRDIVVEISSYFRNKLNV